MGEYKINWNEDEIVVDGHRCKRVEEGVYEVQDKYMIFEEEWIDGPRNKDLHILAIYNGDSKLQEVRYVCPEIHRYIVAAAKRVMYTSVFCRSTGDGTLLCNAIVKQ